MSHAASESALQESVRVEAFSDGVFAIAITLLVLELKVPHPGEGGDSLAHRLAEQWPSYVAFLTSFATIGIMWLNHHRLFHLVRRVDHTLVILNGLLLLGVTVVPFPTALIADYLGRPEQRLASVVYAGTFVYIAFAFNLLWNYVSSAKRNPALMHLPHDHADVVAIRNQYRWAPAIYILAFFVAWWSPVSGLALDLAMAAFFAIPPRRPTEV